MSAYLIFFFALARADSWTRLGKPNCPEHSCIVNEPNASFEITMTTAAKDDLTFLRQIEITNSKTKVAQTFTTNSVNGAEGEPAFEILSVTLRGAGLVDLALYAFDSAGAGPAYIYFLYDPSARTFNRSETTIPKLVRDKKTGQLKTAVQGVPFVVDQQRLRER